jgi:hypothetical protein
MRRKNLAALLHFDHCRVVHRWDRKTDDLRGLFVLAFSKHRCDRLNRESNNISGDVHESGRAADWQGIAVQVKPSDGTKVECRKVAILPLQVELDVPASLKLWAYNPARRDVELHLASIQSGLTRCTAKSGGIATPALRERFLGARIEKMRLIEIEGDVHFLIHLEPVGRSNAGDER